MLRGVLGWMRRWRLLLLALAGLLLLAFVVLLGIGWYFAGALKDGALQPDYDPDKLDLRVVSVDGGAIVLGLTSDTDEDGDWQRDGTYGLEWDGGYGRVGAILQLTKDSVLREFEALGAPPPVGAAARLD